MIFVQLNREIQQFHLFRSSACPRDGIMWLTMTAVHQPEKITVQRQAIL